MKRVLISLFLFSGVTALKADPLITSWYTGTSSKYARIYTTSANRTSGTSATTWSGTQSQTSPAYAGVNEINSSATYVYIRTSGLAAHVMGPWNNPNLPKNQALVWRFPRTPTIPGSNRVSTALTGMGAIGFLVDGVAAYNTSDGFSYSYANSTDATPVGGIGAGDGIWNRDAFPNESVSFDFALAHNQPSGEYHYHVNPVATRYLVGDNVTYDSAAKTYAENTATTSFQHSPIIGWMKDGLPLYGAYGYDGGSTGATASATISGGAVTTVNMITGGTLYQSVPLVTFSGGGGSGAAGTAVVSGGVITGVNITSGGSGYASAPTVKIGGVRRMISGYQLRDGTNGTTNLTTINVAVSSTTGRTSLPAWALTSQNRAQLSTASQYGPVVNTTYALGHYAEDYDYLGDLGYTQGSRTNSGGVFFDLNEYNTRFCVTPEYPNGTWAYFTTIKSDGTSAFPYSVGRWYRGSPTTGGGSTTATVMNADTPLTNQVLAGANTPVTVNTPGVSSGTVSLTWSAVEGGTYSVDASTNQSIWTSEKTGLSPTVPLAPTVGSVTPTTSASYTTLGSSGTEYARVNRTALATYDANGQTAATVAQSTIASYSAGVTNTAPTITSIGAQSTMQNTATSAIAFTIGDAETAAASLTVSGTSSNTTLVPNASLVFGGSGASRTVTITPAPGQTGTGTITVTVSDGSLTANTSFALTVSANTPPTITSITGQTTVRNTPTTAISFTIGDVETAAASLTMSGSSSNATLVPNANIVFSGTGTSRSVIITPATGQSGTATITVTVSDGTTTTSTTFTLTVPPPNILLIIADDYGLDASSLYNTSSGVSLPPTPNIVSLATNGLQFNHAYTYTVCSPSRSCIFTGRYGFRTGTGNVVGGAASNNSLQSTEFTLADAFAASSSLGYQLKQFGKWHLGGANTAPCAIGGWPTFAGSIAGEITDYYSWPKVVTDGTAGGTTTSTSTTYATTDQVNDAVSFINTQTTAGKPWFAWVAFNAPHTPLHLPPTSLCPHYAALSGTAADISANPLSYYNAAVEAMDTEIGRLLASVDLNKTDVIFIGDNGTPPLTLQSPYPANHGKASLYEGGIRVPLIMRGPDVVAPGRTSDVLTHFVDLYSTVLQLAGINVASTVPSSTVLDSQSLLPVLQNQTVTRSLVYGDYFDLAFPTLTDSGRCLRDSQYKLIRYKAGTDEFFDLQADPYESTNLLANGVAAMTTARQNAYNTLVTQLGTYNTAPTITAIADQGTTQSVPTGAVAFTIGDAEMAATSLGVSATSSNTTLAPVANIVIGGTGASRTVTVTPASGLTGTATITVSVTDAIFTTSSSFLLTVGSVTTVNSVATNPATPTSTDAVTVTASVAPAAGTSVSNVQLSYNTGAQTTTTPFNEIFSNASTAAGIAGSMNAWTPTNVRAAADVKQRGGIANHTAPIVLSACATTSGSTTVTCTSTSGLIPGMLITGTNIGASTTISSITNGTTLVLSASATGTGTGLSLTAAGLTLTNCTTTSASTTVTCDSTTGLAVGMGITTLVTNPPGPTVATITNGTTFTLNAPVTTGASGLTLTASGCGLEFSNGTSTYTDTMATLTNPINASAASAGSVSFWVRTSDLISNNGWTFQVSPDGGTTWNTRASESYSASTVALTGCTLNGTTTVTCASTSGLTAGMVVQGTTVSLASCGTTNTSPTVTCTNTTGLAVGMFLTGNGIAPNTRVTAVTTNTNFTMSANASATASVTVLANLLNANTTVASITNGTSFVLAGTTPVYTGTGLALNATTINHAFTQKTYSFTGSELTANLKMRFQFSGYLASQPARPPTCDIDDLAVSLTVGTGPSTLTMFDDGTHGDGAAGDGVYGATIPVQTAGTTVSYTVTATDSAAGTATGSGSYTVATAAPVLAVTPSTTLSSAGAAGGSSFSPSSIVYTLTNNGTGTMGWTAAKTVSWLTLDSTSGTLAAGASTTVTASINAANANGLSAATYNDTITFTNTTTGTGNATRAASLLVTTGTPTAPAAPVLAALAAYSSGTSKTITWPGVANATGYTIQIASDSGFTTNVVQQTVTSTSASFANLTNGVTYYYRVLASNTIGSSTYSNSVSSTQDTGLPAISISTPSTGTSTATNTITITGASSDALSGVASVTVNTVAATTSNNYATWSATIPLGFGTNAVTATAIDAAGNLTTSTAISVTLTASQTYNPLIIPDVITGTTFNLALSQTSKQFPAWATPTTLGTATTTMGYNGALMWGPTLILNQGDVVQMNVTNNLDKSASPLLRGTTTTVHWHGLHIPAIMDGGPHQTVPAGTTWSPTFTVKNNAATFWYHPHLHTETQEQLTFGAGGFIIVRDPQEAALALPRTYGVDDIPLAMTSRRFLTSNEFGNNQYAQNDGSTSTLDNYGDYVLVNGTINPQATLPKQYVRLRLLNSEIQRGYNIGFSDNRTFYVIGNDQGLLNTPVAVTRMFMMVGERVEILVNLGGDTVGSTIDLKAYNSGQVFGFPGNEGTAKTPTGVSGPENGSLLNNIDFNLLHIKVAATTSNPITSLPATLANNTYWTNSDVTNTRTISITGGGPSTVNGITTSTGFRFDNITYTSSLFNYTINLNGIEKWNVSAGNVFGHALHVHDVKFNIIARTGGTQVSSTGLAAPYESGWKDTVYIPKGETVSLIAKFDDFASNTNSYMFHCHFLDHEDGGMMGQFVVVNNAVEDLAVASFTRIGSNNQIDLNFKATAGSTYNLQYSTDMSNWTDIGSVTSNGTSATFTETSSTRLAQAKGFYRVYMPSVSTSPVITSSTTATATHGTAFSYQITATPAATSYSAVGLPAGLSLNTATGLISGTPTTAAISNVNIIATNAGGTGDAHVVLTVN